MLLGILEAVQEKHPNHYLPPEVLEYLAARTGIPDCAITRGPCKPSALDRDRTRT